MLFPQIKGKKGQLVDVFAGIQRSINWLLTTAPKPLLLILFLLFIVAFGSVFGFLLNTTGNFCDTAGNEYRTGTFSLLTNFQLMGNMPHSDELDSETLDADDYTSSTITECSFLYSSTEWKYTELGSKDYENLTSRYYFQDDGCITCEHQVWAIPQGFLGGYKSREKICLDETVYPNEREERTFFAKQQCGKTLGRCAIPEGYYYESSTDTFVCDDELCRNSNGSTNTIGQLWNLKLKESGAKIVPPSEHGDRDYRNAIRIECDNGDIKPALRVFGIEIFDYKLWVMLIILSALVWVMFKIKRH